MKAYVFYSESLTTAAFEVEKETAYGFTLRSGEIAHQKRIHKDCPQYIARTDKDSLIKEAHRILEAKHARLMQKVDRIEACQMRLQEEVEKL